MPRRSAVSSASSRLPTEARRPLLPATALVLSRVAVRAAVGIGVALAVLGCGSPAKGPADLVFVSTRSGYYALYAMDATGGRQRRLTSGKGDPSTPSGLFFQAQPAWSPDARSIAFTSSRDGVSHIFVVAADGGETRRVTLGHESDVHPTWSPDSRRIAFVRGDPGVLETVNADGTGLRRVSTKLTDDSDPAWSPNGQWIAFIAKPKGTDVRDLWLVRPDGSDLRQLTHLNAISYTPAWSPDSRRLVFTNNSRASFDLYTIGVDGRGLTRLTSTGDDDFEPDWSPDGKMIAFTRNGAIVAIAVGGGVARQLTRGTNDSSPMWSPRLGV